MTTALIFFSIQVVRSKIPNDPHEVHENDAQKKLFHLQWSIISRARTQSTTFRLYRLLKQESEVEVVSDKDLRLPTGTTFALWRSAFLTYREGTKIERRDHAIKFLDKMLDDNTISFATDKQTNGWSFNVYIEDAKYRLAELSETYPSIVGVGLSPVVNASRQRWDCLQEAFERMVALLES